MDNGGTSLTFGVLGAVAVWSPTGPLAIREPRRRAVLGALVLEAGRAVSVRRLADLVWGDDPPATSRKAVQVYVCQLRRTLAELPDVELATQPDGYRLICSPEAVDLHVFHRLVAQARRQRLPTARIALFKRALALWRGPAFADTGPYALREQVAPGLEEERLNAVEDLYDAELAAGGQAAILGPLVALVAEYPLRERLAGQLMTALHRCGRAADAAQVFRTFRRRLVREVGIEPSATLCTVHRQVLGGPTATRAIADDLRNPSPASPVRLLELADWYTRIGDLDRALSFLHAARALARDQSDRVTFDRATRAIQGGSRSRTGS